MGWSFVLANLDGRSLGEVRARGRRVSLGVSKPATAACTISDTDPLWEGLAAGSHMLKVFDPLDRLAVYGPIIADDETATGQGAKVTVQAADLSWRLTKRFVGKKTAATDPDLSYTAQESDAIMFDVLAQANADEATGIQAGNGGSYVPRTVSYAWKRSSEILAELGAIDGSYEWQLRYTDGSPPTVYLDLIDRVGTTRTTTFFEYMPGGNCSSYSRRRSLETLATDFWALGSGTGSFAAASDAAARATMKRHEEVASMADISVVSLLAALAAAHVAIRAKARVVVDMQPSAIGGPEYGVDWEIGDTVQAYAEIREKARVDGAVRIWAADFDISDEGVARPKVSMVAE